MPTSTPFRAAIMATLVLLAGCGENVQKPASAAPPPAVTVAKPVKRTVVDQDEYVGRFVAIDSVEIRARVSGYLDQILFTDGQMVNKGDLLSTIDKRPFQTALDEAVANLEQAPRQSCLHGDRFRPRSPARKGKRYHGACLRSAHPGKARR